jgi:nitrate/nitrite transporter NarK
MALFIDRSNESGTVVYYMLSISLILPLAGWLADARIGRYRVIRCSIWIMWIATVLATAVSSVLAQCKNATSSSDAIIKM